MISEFLAEHGLTATTIKTTAPLPQEAMAYAEVEQMAMQLVRQLQLLEARGYTILFWQPSAILVTLFQTGQTLYLLAGGAPYVPLDKKDASLLVLRYPPLLTEWCAPELRKIPALPFLTHRSASYYSLALVCLAQTHLSLAELQGTKLFYFLERCLKHDPKERLLLYL
jgi:hypothetical protein